MSKQADTKQATTETVATGRGDVCPQLDPASAVATPASADLSAPVGFREYARMAVTASEFAESVAHLKAYFNEQVSVSGVMDQ